MSLARHTAPSQPVAPHCLVKTIETFTVVQASLNRPRKNIHSWASAAASRKPTAVYHIHQICWVSMVGKLIVAVAVIMHQINGAVLCTVTAASNQPPSQRNKGLGGASTP